MVRLTETVARERLANVPPEKQFWCCDGHYLNNLEELKSTLERMSDGTFLCHVTENKNDFAKWVDEVIGDDKLARDLKKSRTPAQAAKAVTERITWLKSKTVAA